MTKSAQSVESAFSERWKRLMKQARCTKTHVANDVNASMNRSYAAVDSGISNCAPSLSNCFSPIQTSSSKVAPSAKLGAHIETMESDLCNSSKSDAGSSNVGGSSG